MNRWTTYAKGGVGLDPGAHRLELFELDDEQWLKIRRRSYQRRQKQMTLDVKQLPLTHLDVAIWLAAYLCANEI